MVGKCLLGFYIIEPIVRPDNDLKVSWFVIPLGRAHGNGLKLHSMREKCSVYVDSISKTRNCICGEPDPSWLGPFNGKEEAQAFMIVMYS